MSIRAILLAASGLLSAVPVQLQAEGVEISPFFGYRFGGELEDALTGATYSIQDGSTYGLMLDLPLGNSGMRTELLWARQDTRVDLKGAYDLEQFDMTIDSWELGAIAEETKDKYVEYISAHVGLTHLSAPGYGSDSYVNLSAGVGAKFFLSPKVALKTEVRAFCTFVDAEATFVSIGGISVLEFTSSTLWQGQATVGLSVIF